MKKFLLSLLILSFVFITVSCNLDNDEGLFQEAGNSYRHEKFNSFSIVGKGTDNLMVATDKGVYEYGKSTYHGNGVIARNAIYADADKIVFFNDGFLKEEEAGFYVFDNASEDVSPLSNGNLEGYVLAGSPYSTDGEHFSLVFRKKNLDNTYDFKIAYASLTSVTDVISLAPVAIDASSTGKEIVGVTIVGADQFLLTLLEPGSKMNKSATYYVVQSGSISFTTPAAKYYWGVTGDVTMDYEGTIKHGTSNWSTDLNVTNRVAMYNDTTNKKVLIIPSFSSNVYVVNKSTEKLESIAISGLNSLYVFSIVGVDTDGSYIAMTASTGLINIDLEKEKIL